ncbi:rhomboid family intramembrane serine protease [Candidatus Bathyarchaeota archaeon]|nr:MAG: rhomboid family intramembrane serine protease [Candidatus Bathyarchaeota archaeon]
MLPLRDVNPVSKPPLMTRALLLANVALFMPVLWAFVTGDQAFYASLMRSLGLVPGEVLAMRNLYSFITCMFVHADLLHIMGNMLYLHIFGDNVEDVLGRARFLAFYLSCGLVASLSHILVCSLTGMGLDVPVVGASGAISGILGAYMIFFPRARILTLIMGYRGLPVQIRAVYYILGWFAYQVIWALAALSLGLQVSVAFWAHIGGFLAGLSLGYLLKEEARTRAEERSWIGW